MKKITVLIASWKSPQMLDVCLTSLNKSFSTDSSVKIILNEGTQDLESLKVCNKHNVEFIVLNKNIGAPAVDYASHLIDSEYVTIGNDDFIFQYGWDQEMINIIEKYYPCSASCSLVEPINTNNPVTIVDDLGSILDPNTIIKFEENTKQNKYFRPNKIISYTHPITIKTSDYFKIRGYSDNFDIRWSPNGYGLDDYAPYRLWKLHNENFKFIASNKYFVYHGISQTNKKVPKEKHNDGWQYFYEKTGIIIPQFREKIHCFAEILDKN